MGVKKISKDDQKKKKDKFSRDGPKFNKASKQSFKTTKGSNAAVLKPEALSLQLEDEVPDFPRGSNFLKLLCFPFGRLQNEENKRECDLECAVIFCLYQC
jgi:hypothetical protein